MKLDGSLRCTCPALTVAPAKSPTDLEYTRTGAMKVVLASFSYSAEFGPATAFASTPMLYWLVNSRRGVASSVMMQTVSTDFAPTWSPRLASLASTRTGRLQWPSGFLTIRTPYPPFTPKMNPALNWFRIITARACCQIRGGMEVAGLAMNSRSIASQVSTRTTCSERADPASPARADAAPRAATRAKVSNFFMADVIVWYRRAYGPPEGVKQGAGGLERAHWTRFRFPPPPSSQAPGRDLVLVPAQVVPQLVEVGQPCLRPEGIQVALGLVPEIGRVEMDPGRIGVPPRVLGPERTALEKAEQVGLEALGQQVGAGSRLEADGHGLRRLAYVGGQLPERGGNHVGGGAPPPRILHLISVDGSNRSNRSPMNQSPTAASPARMGSTARAASTMAGTTPMERGKEKMMRAAANAPGAVTRRAISSWAIPTMKRWPKTSMPPERDRVAWNHPGSSTMIMLGTISWTTQTTGAAAPRHSAAARRTAGVSHSIWPPESSVRELTIIRNQSTRDRIAAGARISPCASLQLSIGNVLRMSALGRSLRRSWRAICGPRSSVSHAPMAQNTTTTGQKE